MDMGLSTRISPFPFSNCDFSMGYRGFKQLFSSLVVPASAMRHASGSSRRQGGIDRRRWPYSFERDSTRGSAVEQEIVVKFASAATNFV
jgi:hypothetical protein